MNQAIYPILKWILNSCESQNNPRFGTALVFNWIKCGVMKTIGLLFAALSISISLTAQGPTIGVNTQMTIPQDNFSENYAGLPIGVGAQIAIPLGFRSPVQLGFDISKSTMGSENDQFTFENGFNQLIAGDMSVNSTIRSYHGFMRFSPLNGPARVYIDGYAGVRNYSTRSSVEIPNANGGFTQQIEVPSSDNSFSYGWGVGMMLGVNRFLKFDFGFQKLQGGEVTFINPQSISIDEDGDMEYQMVTSETNVLVPRVGLTLTF